MFNQKRMLRVLLTLVIVLTIGAGVFAQSAPDSVSELENLCLSDAGCTTEAAEQRIAVSFSFGVEREMKESGEKGGI